MGAPEPPAAVNFRIEVRPAMEKAGRRRGDRIEIETPVEVSGADCLGFEFFDRTHAQVISRHGGKISLERKLVPQQEVTIRCLANGREAAACVVGQVEKCSGPYCYGFKFLDEKDHIWDVEFPPQSESEAAIGRVALECIGCKSREVIYLGDFELEVLEANGDLSRPCKRCGDVSLWRKPTGEMPGPEVAATPHPTPAPPISTPPLPTPSLPPPVPAQVQERRREPRRPMRVTACVRTVSQGEDLVKTRNVSRGGLCFSSPWQYAEGEAIEVAVPYSPGGGNIFLPAKIVWIQFLPAEATRIYGVCYVFFKG